MLEVDQGLDRRTTQPRSTAAIEIGPGGPHRRTGTLSGQRLEEAQARLLEYLGLIGAGTAPDDEPPFCPTRRLGPELLTWRVRSWGVGLAFDAVADGRVGVEVAGSGLGELPAEGVEGTAAAGGGGGIEPGVEGG